MSLYFKIVLTYFFTVYCRVETCKPLILRKKLVQCTNLLDVVKFLAINADISKIQLQDTSSDRLSISKVNSSQSSKQNVCDVCSCVSGSCKCKQKSGSCLDMSLDSCVEATALEDLPGNHGIRKKHVKVLEKEVGFESSGGLNDGTKQTSNTLNNSGNVLNNLSSNTHSSQMKLNESSSIALNTIPKPTDTPECREKIEEFNTILKKVCKNNKSKVDTRLFSLPQSDSFNKSNNDSSFQDFASGVRAHENRNVPVPDSSTSENSTNMASVANNTNTDLSNNLNEVPKSDVVESQARSYCQPRLISKDQKIKIISDVKVDKPFPPINKTSTPLMQTILINGRPAYNQSIPMIGTSFTKDEIMAMPTIIVVPASGPPPNMCQVKPVQIQKMQKVNTNTVPAPNLLGPLVIDVSSNNVPEPKKPETELPNLDQPKPAEPEPGLVKTVDIRNASVPKDNVIAGEGQTNTPQVLPPLRRSSSTPRRNSHIRVLDFTTPRRILHETIKEVPPSEINENPVDVVVSRSPNLVFTETAKAKDNIVDMSNVKVHKIESCLYNSLKKDSDIKPVIKSKKTDWDADLRALATASVPSNPPPKAKPRPKKPKNKKAVDTQSEGDNTAGKAEKTEDKKPRKKRQLSPKPNKSKKRRKLEEEEEQYAQMALNADNKPMIKPTFVVVPAYSSVPPEADKPLEVSQNKPTEVNANKSNSDDINETPEAERLSLQNEIGARLNISEFLETPYKQALYDIQMETPKFLGSLPDEPISDIKIMSIPTPRFFDTPKPAHATPSYSSRATDYSSGGSYYKPDDQDYLRIADLECPVSSSKDEPPPVEAPNDTATTSKRSSRPVRKCTKNVSYVSSSNISCKPKEKPVDDNIEKISSCSDTTVANSSLEISKDVNLKTPKTPKLKSSSTKSDAKKKLGSSKKRKSPMKKDRQNSFMKIKPRRLTPIKDNKRSRRKTEMFSQSVSSKSPKKRLSAKEKNTHITPVVSPAPTKSRRKSSTPRKLHCTKTFNSESSGHESPEMNAGNKHNKQNPHSMVSSLDSDTEQLALRWSDDGSQDGKPKDVESEDICKIKEYIATTVSDVPKPNSNTGNLHSDLVKRGFDAETAKIIERDLLDSPSVKSTLTEAKQTEKNEGILNRSIETDTSTTNELQIVQDDDLDDEIELSVYECHEDSNNYVQCKSDTKDRWQGQPITLKDKFSMEVCIDDGVAIRLRATHFETLFNNEPDNSAQLQYSFRETEVAVNSISGMDRLYTPMKDHKAQCFEIFDSTLTSLDTPLKAHSPTFKEQRINEIEIVLEEEENVETKDNAEVKKRRIQSSSSEEPLNENNESNPDAQYLFNSTNIQNIDIESVLKKLHGP
ncbi:uncharacterized protein LOC111355522 isoform X2 [Spodoptera litura]|uniref:Uncharacterized protein LOC111355522 isoform X2 n=1 Tax=Spodoptera litura TaxID=69820 RepID=A0A9J7IRK4_SPOLT|nr:uncharacterized protein LOC111355522 isoform X2 [Spodoptera litura]